MKSSLKRNEFLICGVNLAPSLGFVRNPENNFQCFKALVLYKGLSVERPIVIHLTADTHLLTENDHSDT